MIVTPITCDACGGTVAERTGAGEVVVRHARRVFRWTSGAAVVSCAQHTRTGPCGYVTRIVVSVEAASSAAVLVTAG